MNRETAEIFDTLRTEALQQSLSGEFPVWLMAQVMAVVQNPERHAGQSCLIRKLASQLRDYDPYAGAGCFGTGASAGMIETTLRQLAP